MSRLKKISIVVLGILILLNSSGFREEVLASENQHQKKELLPMPPLSELPYKDIVKEWNSMTYDRYVVRQAQLYWKTWTETEKIWDSFKYNNKAWGLIGDTYSWVILPNQMIEKRWTKDLPEGIQNLENNQIYDGYPIFLQPEGSTGDDKFKTKYDNSEYHVFPTSNINFTMYAHEAFHDFQSNWQLPENLPIIGTPEVVNILKKSPGARKINRKIYVNLRNAVLDSKNEKQYLENTKKLLNQYYIDYEEEAHLLHSSTIIEGSAKYFDIAITVRALFGMDASDVQIDDAYKKIIENHWTLEKYDSFLAEEIYYLPGLAGILLERNQIEGWKDRVEKGERIVDILINSVE